MPIYEYRCEDCGTVSEILVRNTQQPVKAVCSACESSHMSRIISVPGAVMSTEPAPACTGHAPENCPHSSCCRAATGQCPAPGMHH